MTRTQHSAQNTVFSLLVKLVIVFSNFIVKTIIVKQLGVEYSGVSSLFVDVLAILSLAELGFGTATSYALYKPLYDNDKDRIKSLMGYYRRIYLYIVIAIIVVGGACAPFIHNIVKNVPDIKENIAFIFILYVLQTAASYSFVYKSTLLDANQEKSVVSLVTLVSTIVFAIVESIILILTGNYIFYLVAMVIYYLATNVAISFVAGIKFPFLKEKDITPLAKEDKKEINKNVRALAIYKICSVMQKSIDSIIISIMCGTASVGYLANYRLISNNIDGIFGQVVESTRSSVGNLAVSEPTSSQYDVYKRMNMLSFLIGNFITVSLFVLLNPFINAWFGQEFVLGLEISMVICVDVYILTMSRTYENFRVANSLFVEGKFRPVFMAIINIVLSIIFGKLWGIFGILLATIIARLTTHAWYDPWLINRRVFKKSFSKYLFVKIIAMLFVAMNCAITYFAGALINTSNDWVDFILKALLCLVIPNITALIAFGRTSEFKSVYSSSIKTIQSRFKKNRETNDAN